jgi:hypothetical protein
VSDTPRTDKILASLRGLDTRSVSLSQFQRIFDEMRAMERERAEAVKLLRDLLRAADASNCDSTPALAARQFLER